MKFTKYIISLIYICFFFTSLSLKVKRRVLPKSNLLFDFLQGLLDTLKTNTKLIYECAERKKGWLKIAKREKKLSSLDIAFKKVTPTLRRIVSYFSKVNYMICEMRKGIMFHVMNHRRRRFFEKQNIHLAHINWSISTLWNYLGNKATNAAIRIREGDSLIGKQKVGGEVWKGKQKEDILVYLQKVLHEVFKPSMRYFKSIKRSLIDMLEENHFFHKIRSFIKCIANDDEIIKNKELYSIYRLFSQLVPDLNMPNFWTRFILGLFCSWEDTVDAIEYLKQGLKEVNKERKYKKFGKFLGKIMMALAQPF